MNLNLTGRKAIITGASRGIGSAIAKGLAEEGVNVALLGRNPAACRALSEALADDYGVQAPIIQLDLLERERIKPAVDEAVFQGSFRQDGRAVAGHVYDAAPLPQHLEPLDHRESFHQRDRILLPSTRRPLLSHLLNALKHASHEFFD